jgi:hypothetical protein
MPYTASAVSSFRAVDAVSCWRISANSTAMAETSVNAAT